MATATLTFDLTEVPEKQAHIRALRGTEAYLVIHSIFEDSLRRRIKYGELSTAEVTLLEEIRSEIHDYLDYYGVDMNDLE